MSAISDVSWQQYGACVNLPDKEFDPFVSKTDHPAVKRVRRICAECSVKDECLEYGYSNKMEGIWGGRFTADSDERRSIALYNTLRNTTPTAVSVHQPPVNLPVFKLQIPK